MIKDTQLPLLPVHPHLDSEPEGVPSRSTFKVGIQQGARHAHAPEVCPPIYRERSGGTMAFPFYPPPKPHIGVHKHRAGPPQELYLTGRGAPGIRLCRHLGG